MCRYIQLSCFVVVSQPMSYSTLGYEIPARLAMLRNIVLPAMRKIDAVYTLGYT